MCKDSFPPPPPAPILAAFFPLVLNIQLNNACSNNNNRCVFSFFFLFVHKGLFCKVYINFLIIMMTLTRYLGGGFGNWRLKTFQHFQCLWFCLRKIFSITFIHAHHGHNSPQCRWKNICIWLFLIEHQIHKMDFTILATKLALFIFELTISFLSINARRAVEVYGIGKLVTPCLLIASLFS